MSAEHTLRRLDASEGCDAGLFRRERRRVTLEAGEESYDAWLYVFARSPAALPRLHVEEWTG